MMPFDLALSGGTIYTSPLDAPLRNGAVLIRAGKIAAVASGAEFPLDTPTLDCSGRAVTAGFWNSHVHFFERKWADAANIPAPELARQLQAMLTRYGFTTVFDLSSMWENTRRLRDRIESGEVPGPRILSTGEGLLPPNPGLPPDAVLSFMGVMKMPLPEIADAGQAAAAAAKLLDAGTDAIKLFISAPSKASLSQDAICGAVREAHARGKAVFVHPNNAADVWAAVNGGVDIIAHTTPNSGPWDEALLRAMQNRGVALTPTLQLWQYFTRHDRLSVQQPLIDTALGQLRAWLRIGGTVLFGTDLGAVEYDPSDEYLLMAEAGMTFPQILASLTTAPAARFGGTARISAEMPADLVVLKQDPSKDIRALAEVEYTIRGGKIIYQASA